MNIDDIPLTREQLTIVGMAVALVTVAAAAPALLAPSPSPTTESATNGTVYTETPETDQTDDTGDDGPIQDMNNEGRQPETDLSKVPDSHVQSNGTAPPVSASTGAQTLRVSTMRIDGKPALNLTDSRQHDGRWVSVTTAWLKSEYGTIPEVVGVRHESGGSYSESVHVREDKAVFWVRGFSTNVVTFGGVLEIVGKPAASGTTHLYEVGDLDDASDPTIDLTGQVNSERDTKQVLGVSNGETIPLSVAADHLQPQNPEVTFTGVEQQSTDNSLFSTVLSDGGSTDYSIDGNADATDVSVTFTGYETTTDQTITASNRADGETFDLSVGGTRDANATSVTFTGDETTSSGSASRSNLGNGDTFGYTVDGNRNANDVTVRFEGDETTSSGSASGTGSGSINVGGNIDATGESVFVTGRETTNSRTISGSGNPSLTESITVDGNLSPANPDLTVTAHGAKSTESEVDERGLSKEFDVSLLGGKPSNYDGDVYKTEAAIIPNSDGEITSIAPRITNVRGSDYGTTVDVYISQGGVNGNYREGTKVATWDPDWSTGHQTITLDTPYAVTAGSTFSIEFVTNQNNDDSDLDTLEVANADSSNNYYSTGGSVADHWADIDYTIDNQVTDLSVSAGDGTTVSLADFSDGQTKTVDLPISEDANQLDFSATRGGSLDYSLDLTERTATEDPAIDVDGDGSPEASWSGIYTGGETTSTKTVDGLASGSVSVDTSTSTGPQPDWSLDWTEKWATKDPSIDVDGDGADEVTYSGTLTSGEIYSASVSNLSPGSYTASVATGYQVDATIDYTERRATENPGIDIDGDGAIDASYSGKLLDGESVTKQLPTIATGSHTATVSTTAYRTDVAVNWTERTTTKDPAVDLDGDGQADASYSGVLPPGDTATKSVGNLSSGSHTATVSTVHKVGVDAGSTVRTVTEDPTLDIDADGQPDAEYLGKLTDGESQTVQISDFDGNVTGATVSTDNGVVDVRIGYTERVISDRPGVIVNNHTVRLNRTLSQDDTASLAANASWLQSGQNNVTVLAGDSDLSTNAPEPTVAITYRHELTTRRTVLFENEAFSERYNISRTYLSSRESATLTIPHAKNIISYRALEARIDESGGWATIPQSALTIDGTSAVIDVASLTGGTVPADTTVEIRSTGSKIDVHNGSVTVVEATPVGFDLDSRVRLDTWSDDSYISVANTSQGHLLHYGANESYSAESDYAALSTGHGQRVHFPEAVSGSEVGLKTVPLALSPENGTIRASVPEGQTNATAPVFYVSSGERVGDGFTVEYTGASEGEWYGVYEVDTTHRFDRAQGRQTMSVPTDSIDSLIRVRTAPAPSANPEGASTVFEAASQGNLVPLAILFGAITGLVIVGRRPERSRNVVESTAASVGSLVEAIPRGELVSSLVETVIATVGEWIVTVGENEFLTGAIGLATVAAAIQSGLLQIGPEAGAIGTVGAIAVGSLLVLTRTGEFTTARWLGIVIVSGVVSLQALGEGDLLTTLVESDAFVLVLILVGYVAIQLVREYRANNSPDDDQPEINIIAGRGGND